MSKLKLCRFAFCLSKAVCLAPIIFLGILSASAWAADLPGAKDHPILKRFAGSEIVGYDVKRFDMYELQTSTFTSYNTSTKQREYASPPLKLEGAITRIWYEARGEASATELLRNYQNELKDQGFQILYDSTQDGEVESGYLAPFGSLDIKTNRSTYIFYAANPKGVRVSTAKLERPEGDVYVSLTAVDWGSDDAIYKANKGAYIAVDIIEARPMKQNMLKCQE